MAAPKAVTHDELREILDRALHSTSVIDSGFVPLASLREAANEVLGAADSTICPECGEQLKTPQGVRLHRYKAHAESTVSNSREP